MAVLHHTCFLVLLFIAGLCGSSNGQTLWDKMQSSTFNISKFRDLVKQLKLTSFINVASVTVYVPDDNALTKTPITGTDAEKINIVKYHMGILQTVSGTPLVGTTANFDNNNVRKFGDGKGFGKFAVPQSKFSALPLYWLKKVGTGGAKTEYFINNAEFKDGEFDQTGGTGVFHVISEVITPVGKPKTAYEYLKETPTLTTFQTTYIEKLKTMSTDPEAGYIVNAYSLSSATSLSTFFVPSNAALSAVPTAERDKIVNNKTRLIHFVVSHIANNQLVFASWMKTHASISLKMKLQSISFELPATVYRNKKTDKNFVSAGHVVGEVIGKTQPLKNGIVVVINRPLNLLYESITDIIRTKTPDFHSSCSSVPKCKAIMDAGNCTVFAPQLFPSTVRSLPAAQLEPILLMHFLPGHRLSLATMPEMGVTFDTAENSGKVRFTLTATGGEVEARMTKKVGPYSQGFVGSQIVEPDRPATNGMVQVLATYLSQPTLTIHALLNQKYSNFSLLMKCLADLKPGVDLNIVTKQQYTFFAPTNAAFSAMTDSIGKKILGDKQLRVNLLKRLILMNTALLSNLTVDTNYEATTALAYEDDEYTHTTMKIKVTRNVHKTKHGVNATITQGNINIGVVNRDAVVYPYQSEWGCTNGIVYALNSIPYGSATVGRVCKTVCGAFGQSAHLSWLIVISAAIVSSWVLSA